MQPLGRKPLRFPGKTDCHPRKPEINWWEDDHATENKALEKRRANKEIEEGKKEWKQQYSEA